MKRLPASKLAESLDLEPNEIAYFDYIILSDQNGQMGQVKRLFDQMNEHSQMLCIGYLNDCEQYDLITYITYHLIQK
jgi:hypothetical protein